MEHARQGTKHNRQQHDAWNADVHAPEISEMELGFRGPELLSEVAWESLAAALICRPSAVHLNPWF